MTVLLYNPRIKSLKVNVRIVWGAILKKCAVEPLYHAKGPSAFSVFHKQSIGFLYSVPTNLPFGSCFVGWLYTRVKAVSAGCITTHTQTPATELLAKYVQILFAGRMLRETN